MEPIGLMHIRKILIPREFVDSVYEAFRETGAEGYERLALFAGKKNGTDFSVTNLIFPKQRLTKSAHGIGFIVEGEELERLGDWLFNNDCHLIAQVHSHPGEAYHSETDDELSIITKNGGISIVVPDFGNYGKDFENCAFFRLLPTSGWTELPFAEIRSLISIIE